MTHIGEELKPESEEEVKPDSILTFNPKVLAPS